MPTGRIKYYNLDKGFGFIAQDNSDEDVFLHSSAIKQADYEELRVGQRVKYNVVEGDKGLVAKNVEVLLTPTERRWLRQGKTIIPKGYSGFPAQPQDPIYTANDSLGDDKGKGDLDTQKKIAQTTRQQENTETRHIRESDSDQKEQASRQLSFGDLYILKQINFETPMFFALYNQVQLPAIVLETTLAALTLNSNEQERTIPKIDIKYCYKDVDAEKVNAILQYNEDIKAKQLKSVLSAEETYSIDAEKIRYARKDGNIINIILREGEIFQGTVDWISPYEIKMVLENGSKVVVFQHAIYEFSVVDEDV